MSKALKCDLCNKYYDYYEINFYDKDFDEAPVGYINGFAFTDRYEDRDLCVNRGTSKDICQDCLNKIINFIVSLKKGALNAE